jgi:hypothetical protein
VGLWVASLGNAGLNGTQDGEQCGGCEGHDSPVEERSCATLWSCGGNASENEGGLAEADETDDPARAAVGEGADTCEKCGNQSCVADEANRLCAGFIEPTEACFADQHGPEVSIEPQIGCRKVGVFKWF